MENPILKLNQECLFFLCSINVTIQLDTNQVRGFLFPAQAHLHWPSLIKKQKIKFPLTQIGNLSVSVCNECKACSIFGYKEILKCPVGQFREHGV